MKHHYTSTAIALALLALAAPSGFAKTASKTPAISTQRLSEDVRIVSADDFEGRGVATRAEVKTIDFISQKFAQAGLKPGGENGGWTQEVRLRKFNVIDPKLSLNLSGSVIDLKEAEDITISSRGAISEVNFADTPLVFVGYGVTAPERGWDDFKGLDVKGKIIVVLINDPDYYAPENNTFNGKAMTYYGRWTYKFEEAARRGAAGVMIIHETGPASYGWNTVKNSNRRDKLDIVRDDPSLASPKLESWISYSLAERMFAASGLDLEALKIKARTKDFQPVVLNGIGLNGGYGMKTEVVISHNVVGILPGFTHPDQTVLYSAHWDHLGIGAPDANGDNIYNGAVDNGTGIAGLIELARLQAKAGKNARSIAFIAFTAEESGLLGSEYYATNPVFPLAKTVAGINMDSMNVLGATRNIEIVGAGQSSLDDNLLKIAKTQKRIVTNDQTPEAGHFFRSDHFPLAKRGVPMLYAGSGSDMVKGGESAGKSASETYVTKLYHQPDDEWSATWDLSGMVQDISLYYQLGRELANTKAWPTWRTTSEFKGARDKSEAMRK